MAEAAEQEGVVKYVLASFSRDKLSDKELKVAKTLRRWRKVLLGFGLIGQDSSGIHYGNMSARVAPDSHRFVISGTQTSGLAIAQPELHYAAIDSYDPIANTATAHGPVEPSSEVPTHAALYAADFTIHAVFHGHSPEMWSSADNLGIPTTPDDVEYGTPEMGFAVQELLAKPAVRKSGIIVMRGHRDGVISFGSSSYDAGATMTTFYRRAQALAEPQA